MRNLPVEPTKQNAGESRRGLQNAAGALDNWAEESEISGTMRQPGGATAVRDKTSVASGRSACLNSYGYVDDTATTEENRARNGEDNAAGEFLDPKQSDKPGWVALLG